MVDGITLDEIAQEQANLKKAAAYVREFAVRFSRPDGIFKVTESEILTLHLIIASNTSIEMPGQYRLIELEPLRKHQPPPFVEVPRHMKEFVDELNNNWNDWSVTKIGAFALWRLNWIHPFCNGNGRTSRLYCYLLMNMKAGHSPFPGKEGHLVPELLDGEFRKKYELCLEHADAGNIATAEELITESLHRQLSSVLD